MPEKPTAEEREWLLARLVGLVHEGGFERLVSAPLIEISDEWFPDRWSPTAAGVQVLLRRLFFHARLPEVEVEVVDLRGGGEDDGSGLTVSEIVYAGRSGERASFEIHKLGKDDVIGMLCHEVGKAYVDLLGIGRAPDGPYRGAETGDGGGPERARLGSIAAVYLGLGVPATNAAQRASATSEIVGNRVIGEWMISTAGGLPAQALAYLLAVQRVVRGRRSPAHAALLTNQRADFEDWCDELEDARDELVRALRLPAESSWPPVTSSLTLVPFDYDDDDPGERPPANRDFNRGGRVFRVRSSRFSAGLILGTTGGLVAAVALLSAPLLALGAGAALVGAGAVIGKRWRRDVCSDPACEERLAPGVRSCPRCGGEIAGEIAHRDERLEREEELDALARQAGAPPRDPIV